MAFVQALLCVVLVYAISGVLHNNFHPGDWTTTGLVVTIVIDMVIIVGVFMLDEFTDQ